MGLDLHPRASPLLSFCLPHTTGVCGCKGTSLGTQVVPSSALASQRGFFHPLQTSAELAVLLEGETERSSHMAHSNAPASG